MECKHIFDGRIFEHGCVPAVVALQGASFVFLLVLLGEGTHDCSAHRCARFWWKLALAVAPVSFGCGMSDVADAAALLGWAVSSRMGNGGGRLGRRRREAEGRRGDRRLWSLCRKSRGLICL